MWMDSAIDESSSEMVPGDAGSMWSAENKPPAATSVETRRPQSSNSWIAGFQAVAAMFGDEGDDCTEGLLLPSASLFAGSSSKSRISVNSGAGAPVAFLEMANAIASSSSVNTAGSNLLLPIRPLCSIVCGGFPNPRSKQHRYRGQHGARVGVFAGRDRMESVDVEMAIWAAQFTNVLSH
jgi:hypothetical protein